MRGDRAARVGWGLKISLFPPPPRLLLRRRRPRHVTLRTDSSWLRPPACRAQPAPALGGSTAVPALRQPTRRVCLARPVLRIRNTLEPGAPSTKTTVSGIARLAFAGAVTCVWRAIRPLVQRASIVGSAPPLATARACRARRSRPMLCSLLEEAPTTGITVHGRAGLASFAAGTCACRAPGTRAQPANIAGSVLLLRMRPACRAR